MIEFLEVKSKTQVKSVSALADKIWREHYFNILAPEQIDYMLKNFQSADAISKAIKTDNYTYYIVRIDGSEVGYFGAKPEEDSVFLSKLYIISWARGKGYGMECVKFICDKAKRAGYSRVWLTLNRGNEGSLAAYQKMGFSIFGEGDVDIGGGFTMNDYYMEKKWQID